MSEFEAASRRVPLVKGVPSAAREAQWREYVRDAAAGKSRALAALYDESCSLVYGIALRVLRNEADAEEVTSDVYVQVWRSASGFDDSRGSVNAWLSMQARSRAIDKLRSRTRREGTIEVASVVGSKAETPEHSSWLGEQRAGIKKALDALSPEQREVIELAYFEGLTQTELAARLGQPLGTVKTRIRMGMIKLKEHLQGSAEAAR